MDFLALARQHQAAIVDFMSRLIKAKSFSGQERQVIELIQSEMQRVSFDEIKIDGLGNVIGRIGSGKTQIAIDAHIDTVEIGNEALWDKDPFSGDYDNEFVYGRGASDQKAGICSAIYGMKLLKEVGAFADFTVYVTATVMEEDCDGLCWRYIIEEDQIRPDFVLITEPTSLNIYRGHRGRIEFCINTVGLSAHASAPERGENAIYKMTKIVNAIEKLNERLPHDPFLGKGSIVVSQIISGSPSINAVPDSCTIHIDRRLTAGETKESVYQEMKQIFEQNGIHAEIVPIIYDYPAYTGKVYPMEKYFPTWTLDENHALVQAACATAQTVFGEVPAIDKWTFSTNGIATAGLYQIPTIGFGPGDEYFAHAPNEKVKIEHLVRAAAFYAAFPQAATAKAKGDNQ